MDKDILNRVLKYKQQSEQLRAKYDYRWTKNLKLVQGIFPESETTQSKVRNRSKIFFRKIWTTSWRLVASFWSAFLQDRDTFKIEGRDSQDSHKARILQIMTEYRRDLMMRSQGLFLQFIWGFQNIINLGWCVGKLSWEFNPKTGQDGPRFIIYPNEQVFPDLTAETKDRMRYIIFENYLTKEDMEELGYENIDKAEAVSIPSNSVRNARHYKTSDPLQNPGDNEYPIPGRYQEDNRKDTLTGNRYRVWEVFYKKDNKIRFVVTNENKVVLKPEIDSPYGDRFPIVSGVCLTEAHKLLGEGFPEPLEGPQESYNANLNMRKDNVALSLNKMFKVSRFASVDLQSLVNQRSGGIVLMDDINAVQEIDHRDVTQSSYIEANQDDQMMEEMSGIVDIKQGRGREQKATTSQINLSEANAKIDLYIAMVSETFIREFYSLLAYQIQRFETDERVFRIANDTFRQETGLPIEDLYDLDFEADCIVNVGLGTVGRQTEIQQTLLAMDRAIMSNQSALQLLQIPGAVPPEGIRLIDTTALLEDILPKLGKKDLTRYFINVTPPQQQEQSGSQNPALAGANQPQIGGRTAAPTASDLQFGSLGGV
ncbi:MAG: hypothetical protein ACE5GV_11615 [Candidatus Scalindua sp.]